MKKIIIIGGGIAGLSTGIFGRLHGFETAIYEMHSIPGGECTGWNRKGYHFDNCIHWLTGTNPDTDLYKVWETVGAFDDTELYTKEYFMAVEQDGQTLYFYKDLVKLKAHLLAIAPEDEVAIEEFVSGIKACQGVGMSTKKPMASMNLFDMMSQMKTYKPIMKYMKEWNALSVAEYAKKFKNPLLNRAIRGLLYNECAMMNAFFMLGTFTSGNGGWPMGGSMAMSNRIAAKYKELGGAIHYKSKVEEIIIQNGKAIGIQLITGEVIKGDYIVSAMDGMMLLKKLLKGKVADKTLDVYEKSSEKFVFPITVDVGLGVKADLSHRPHECQFEIEPIKCGANSITSIGIKQYCIEKGFAPTGCSSIRIWIGTVDSSYWQDLKRQGTTVYEKAKDELAAQLVARVEKIYPETEGLIEVVDVCTPATYERYCDAYKGCWMTPIPKVGEKMVMHKGSLKGIKNLYVAGQWLVSIGGLPTAVISGKWAIQAICKAEKINFKMSF